MTLGKPEGTKEKEIRIAILLFGQRPPRYAGVGRSCSIADAISWGMRVWDFMLARPDTGAGQPVPLISTRMAVILAKMRSRRGLSAARKREAEFFQRGRRVCITGGQTFWRIFFVS